MSLFASFTRLLRKPRGNRRVARFAARAARGGAALSLGAPKQESTRLWRIGIWVALGLLLTQVEAGLLGHVGVAALRVDVTLVIIVFCALHLGAIEGAIAAFLLGYVADLFVQGPPGLCRFLAVATWTTVRLGSARVHLPQLVAPAVFTFAASAVYQLGVLAGLALVADAGAGPGTNAWLALVPQAALTAVAAVPLHGALRRIEGLTERTE